MTEQLLFDLAPAEAEAVELVDLAADGTAWVQCLTCQLVTTADALAGRGLMGHAAHGPTSTTCARYVARHRHWGHR